MFTARKHGRRGTALIWELTIDKLPEALIAVTQIARDFIIPHPWRPLFDTDRWELCDFIFFCSIDRIARAGSLQIGQITIAIVVFKAQLTFDIDSLRAFHSRLSLELEWPTALI